MIYYVPYSKKEGRHVFEMGCKNIQDCLSSIEYYKQLHNPEKYKKHSYYDRWVEEYMFWATTVVKEVEVKCR